MDSRNLTTVKEFAREMSPIITEGKLRWWIYNADHNGFKHVIVKVGGRIFIDREHFDAWMEMQRLGALEEISA